MPCSYNNDRHFEFEGATSPAHAPGRKIRRHESRLDGPALAKADGTMNKALVTFTKKLDAAIAGRDPSIEVLLQLLQTPAQKLLKPAAWKKLYREVFRTAAPESTSAQLQKAFLARVREQECGEAAFHAV